MHTCDHCASYGLRFQRAYEPHEFIEGNRAARVWIVGLNPAQDLNWVDNRSASELLEYFDDESKIHGYFKQFRVVSEELYERFGKDGGVAHTDLIKCSSKAWPPEGVSSRGRSEIISNCTKHLQRQLAQFQPSVIICNGSEVSAEVKRLLPAPEGTSANATNYIHEADGRRIIVILSGFIGRIDNYSKRRLGVEVEAVLRRLRNAT
jgi:uracil-DNA glycosylase